MTPYLWSLPGWRGRISITSLKDAQHIFGAMLTKLPAQLSQLKASDFLPLGLLRGETTAATGAPGRAIATAGERVAEIVIDLEAEGDGMKGSDCLPGLKVGLDLELRRNPLCVLLAHEAIPGSGERGESGEGKQVEEKTTGGGVQRQRGLLRNKKRKENQANRPGYETFSVCSLISPFFLSLSLSLALPVDQSSLIP